MFAVLPSGEVVQYPTATYLMRLNDGKSELRTAKDGGWVADIPAGWAVGPARPHILGISTDAKALKRALRNFDARTGRWIQEQQA